MSDKKELPLSLEHALQGSESGEHGDVEIWLNAYLDLELSPSEEALMEAALRDKPHLVQRLSRIAQNRQQQSALLEAAASRELTDRIMHAVFEKEEPVGPSAEDDSIHVMHQASAWMDDALTEPAHTEFVQRLEAQGQDAEPVKHFLITSQRVQDALQQWANSEPVKKEFRQCVEHAFEKIEHAHRLLLETQAYVDGEDKSVSVDELKNRSLAVAPSLAELCQEMVSFYTVPVGPLLRAPMAWPEARRAGQAALQAIEAMEQNSRVQRDTTAPVVAPPASEAGWVERLRGAFGPTLAMCGLAAVVMMVSDAAPPALPTDPVSTAASDGNQWVEETVNAYGSRLAQADTSAGAIGAVGKLAVLQNNQADVQTLETGGQSALVFGTAESNITVIWLSEPGEDMVDQKDGLTTQKQQGT